MSLGLEVLLMTIFIMVVSLLIVRIVFMISDSKRPRLFLITFLSIFKQKTPTSKWSVGGR